MIYLLNYSIMNFLKFPFRTALLFSQFFLKKSIFMQNITSELEDKGIT